MRIADKNGITWIMSWGGSRSATRGWMHGITAVATVVVVFSVSCHTAFGLPTQKQRPAGQCRQHTLTELAHSPALILKQASMPGPWDALLLVAFVGLVLSVWRSLCDGGWRDLRARVRRMAWVWARGSPGTPAYAHVHVHAPRSDAA